MCTVQQKLSGLEDSFWGDHNVPPLILSAIQWCGSICITCRLGLEHYNWLSGSEELGFSSKSNMPIKENVCEDKVLTFIIIYHCHYFSSHSVHMSCSYFKNNRWWDTRFQCLLSGLFWFDSVREVCAHLQCLQNIKQISIALQIKTSLTIGIGIGCSTLW